jgi:hypothetical protein
MAKKMKIPEKFLVWIDARKKYHLSHAHIQMAIIGKSPGKHRCRFSLKTFISNGLGRRDPIISKVLKKS